MSLQTPRFDGGEFFFLPFSLPCRYLQNDTHFFFSARLSRLRAPSRCVGRCFCAVLIVYLCPPYFFVLISGVVFPAQAIDFCSFLLRSSCLSAPLFFSRPVPALFFTAPLRFLKPNKLSGARLLGHFLGRPRGRTSPSFRPYSIVFRSFPARFRFPSFFADFLPSTQRSPSLSTHSSPRSAWCPQFFPPTDQ